MEYFLVEVAIVIVGGVALHFIIKWLDDNN